MNAPPPPEQQIVVNKNPRVLDPTAVAEALVDIQNGWDPYSIMGADDAPPTVEIASESGHTDPLTSLSQHGRNSS